MTGFLPARACVLAAGGEGGEPPGQPPALSDDFVAPPIGPGPSKGQGITPRLADRATRLAGTGIGEDLAGGYVDPEVIRRSKLTHHIPIVRRAHSPASIQTLCRHPAGRRIILKVVKPGSRRVVLRLWSGQTHCGHRGVSLVSRLQFVALLKDSYGPLRHEETPLQDGDGPTYATAFIR